MNAELEQQIYELQRMTTAQLQQKYRELFGQESHSNHKNYMFRRVAIPAWRPRSRSPAMAWAVIAMMGMCRPVGFSRCLMSAVASKPPISGI
jgi:hypothetical protein